MTDGNTIFVMLFGADNVSVMQNFSNIFWNISEQSVVIFFCLFLFTLTWKKWPNFNKILHSLSFSKFRTFILTHEYHYPQLWLRYWLTVFVKPCDCMYSKEIGREKLHYPHIKYTNHKWIGISWYQANC